MDMGISPPLTLAAPKATTVVAAPTAAPITAALNQEREQNRATSAPASLPEDGGASLEEAVISIQNFVQSIRRDLNFSLDESSGRVVVKVTDSASGEVIRQLPSEEALRLAESLDEVRSLLFQAEA